MSYIFGPVPSRRLGRSLGVDLVPFKTCSYDCIYCQLGRTTHKTVERSSWVPLDEVMTELKEKLSLQPDYITLGGSGEPTLCSRLGEVIDRIHSLTDIPVAVLTNGALLWQDEVRRQLSKADLVIPSLDAGNEEMFQIVNRPHESLAFPRMLEGLIAFREQFQRQYWLEVFFLADYNDTDMQARAIAACAAKIKADRVQLNTATRPTAETYAVMVSPARMAELARLFTPPAEVIADYHGVHALSEFQAGRSHVWEMIQRRPCSLEDIAAGLNLHRNEVIKYLVELEKEGLTQKQRTGDKVFYIGKQDSA